MSFFLSWRHFPFHFPFPYKYILRLIKCLIKFGIVSVQSCRLSTYVTRRRQILTDRLSWPKLSIILDRHVGDVSVSHRCRWPNDRKRISELLYHWPGKLSCQRCDQDYVRHQQPDRSHPHKRRRPGPRGNTQLRVKMQVLADHDCVVHLTEMPCFLS